MSMLSNRLSLSICRSFDLLPKYLESRFIDKIRLRIKGGNGGKGCASFARDIHGVGGADGGNGGRGGDVYVVTSTEPSDLTMTSYNIKGKNGTNGSSAMCHGRAGEDTTFTIPAGTIISEIIGSEKIPLGEREIKFIADLSEPNITLQLAGGGKGGLGNRAYRSNDRKLPTIKSDGQKGQARYLQFELKTIADVGLVGFPNAGKSTFLNSVSNATPKIASYAFTTLHPNIGTVKFGEESLSIADLPGLISGASENKGLGHSFLRHIERTHVLLYVLDIAGTETRDPVADFLILQRELELYCPGLSKRPSLIFANKIDRKPLAVDVHLKRLKTVTDIPIIKGSNLLKIGLDDILQSLKEKVDTAKTQKTFNDLPIYEVEPHDL